MTTITIDQLTSGSTTGDGVFDKLMEAATIRLDVAYNKGRISSTDYSAVLIQGMGSAMQQSIAYLLGVQNASAQAELTNAQKLIADQDLLNLIAQKTLLDKQALESDQQLLHLTAQTAIVTEGLATAVNETAIKAQQLVNLVNANVKMTADIALSDQALLNAKQDLLKSVAETTLVTQNGVNATTTNTVLDKQQLKIVSETQLLEQKRISESAQTSDIADANSILGKMATLYQRQADGFLRDAEQKATKMGLDTWSIRQSTDGANAATAGIDDPSIKEMVDAMKLGISAESKSITIDFAGGNATAATTADISVVTTDATGLIYYFVSENATETVGAILNQDTKNALTQAGIQTQAITGLTTATTYYAHFVQVNTDGVVSDAANSNAFTTP